MLKKILLSAMVVMGLCATGTEAKAHPPGGGYYGGYRPYYAAPYYGPRYYAPAYSNYGYRYYGNPYYVAPRPVYYGYPAPVYYGPRGGVSYISPRVGVSIGF